MTFVSCREPRVLLIDYHFGTRGATGGARWRAMASHLVDEGWRFDVITVAPAGPGVPRGEEPAEGVRMFRVAPPRLVERAVTRLGALRRRVRGSSRAWVPPEGSGPVPSGVASPPGWYARGAAAVNAVRITSVEWGWARRAQRLGRDLARRGPYDAVVVSSPPHLTQLAGAALTRACGIPYVADFRDPWVFGRPEKHDVNLLANPLGGVYEGPTLRRAARVVCNTEHARRAVAAIYPALAERVVAVPNGYDANGQAPGTPDPRCFRVVFTGWLYRIMDPACVLAAVGRLRRRAGLDPSSLAVEFMGCAETHGGVPLVSLAAKHGLGGCFRVLPRGSPDQARRLQAAAAVLVAFDASTQLAMPTKFYDYARSCGTMLLIGFPDGALAAAAGAIGVRVYHAADAPGIDAALDEALRRWRAGDLRRPLDAGGVFDRRRQSQRMHDLLLGLQGAVRSPVPLGVGRLPAPRRPPRATTGWFRSD
jgi:hypothetical protein